MKSIELEKKLRSELDDDIRIKEHATLAGISNVFWRQYEVCPCPTFDVRDLTDLSYVFEFPNGMMGVHNSIESIIHKVKQTIKFFSSDEGKQLEEDEKKPEVKANFNLGQQIKELE